MSWEKGAEELARVIREGAPFVTPDTRTTENREGPFLDEELAEAIHWHYCETTPLNACFHTDAHHQLAGRLIELMPTEWPTQWRSMFALERAEAER